LFSGGSAIRVGRFDIFVFFVSILGGMTEEGAEAKKLRRE
jgi:hypothetical protein